MSATVHTTNSSRPAMGDVDTVRSQASSKPFMERTKWYSRLLVTPPGSSDGKAPQVLQKSAAPQPSGVACTQPRASPICQPNIADRLAAPARRSAARLQNTISRLSLSTNRIAAEASSAPLDSKIGV